NSMHWMIQTGTSPVYTIQHGGKPPRFSLRSVKINCACFCFSSRFNRRIVSTCTNKLKQCLFWIHFILFVDYTTQKDLHYTYRNISMQSLVLCGTYCCLKAQPKTSIIAGGGLAGQLIFGGQLVVFDYFFFPVFCARALPAADFDALLALPSRRVFDAAVAAFIDVCFFGADRWDRALPAADFDFAAVDLLVMVFDARLAAFLPVTFLFAISRSFFEPHTYQN
ncbi:MAG: hypothetical protein QM483_10135, partial [Desulfuromusa sp.]